MWYDFVGDFYALFFEDIYFESFVSKKYAEQLTSSSLSNQESGVLLMLEICERFFCTTEI